MPTYDVVNKETDQKVFFYTADAPIEWVFMEFATHDHVARNEPPPVVVEHPELGPTEWLLDVGAFFDRFGALKFAVLTSQDVIVKAVVQDVSVRKWIDLRRMDVAQGVGIIAAKLGGALTPLMVQTILTAPVRSEENLALRLMYFSGGNNGA
jgi:hypothetical protein